MKERKGSWPAGNELAEELYDLVRIYIPRRTRQEISDTILKLFEEQGADMLEETGLLWKDSKREKEQPVVYLEG